MRIPTMIYLESRSLSRLWQASVNHQGVFVADKEKYARHHLAYWGMMNEQL